ncbi:MAG: ABC transporter permease [Acidobacteriaceae bacterium]|nr:ABC transporter permease [Acidobacteriaceae bacterium]MBV9676298.1 ABC transporter permease [Acidobacteriaceae bacterium]
MPSTPRVNSSELESRWGRPWAAFDPAYGPPLALLLLIAANLLFTRNFATVSNLWNVLLQVSPTMLVAIGMTLVITTGGIDLSVGSIMAIASAVAATNLHRGPVLASILGLGVAVGIGAFNGALISGFRVQPIVVTLAALIAGRGIAQVISEGGQLISFDNPAFERLGRGHIGPVPVQVVVMIIVVLVAGILVRSTVLGRYILAVGGNEAAANLAGVNVGAIKTAVYAMSGFLAGLAGLIETARLGASDASKVGLNIELDAIAAVVVGGTSLTGGVTSITGTFVGAMIMQIITTAFNMLLIPYSWSLVLKAAIILFVVYLQRPKTV